PIPPLPVPSFGLRFGRREQVGRQLGSEPRPEDLLGRGAEMDPSRSAVMLGLVALGSVNPDPPGSIDVDRPHAANLRGPHAGKALDFDHRPNLPVEIWQRGVNERIGDRPNRLLLPDIATAPAEAGDDL